ncbi:beta-1,3-glucanase family protein [Silvimonas amylolytica]|uniref:GH64 domain-containing protein n=1 Tax=Silvimonas amylolytica TaxID=449663 RepID=A0ABQ2PQK1_9NEIS|nr:beta-1,3-glucanase family protein [Silvimonas amylolytica]GGP27912.1 hypothetical protein GCM10010971_37310 [Silvimonas amylolytica]
MIRSTNRCRRIAPGLTSLALLTLLTACGGGGGSSDTTGSTSTSAPTIPFANSGSGPQITVQPADQTVSAGQRAFFFVTAPGATGWQWYKNGVAIAGATASSYFATSAVSTDDGSTFGVAVASATGVTTSTLAKAHINPNADGSPPAAFWGNVAGLPAASNVMTVSFVNQTGGKYPDAQVFWKISGTNASGGQVNEFHSIADEPVYDMPGINSARMYFFIAPNQAAATTSNTSYYDFIEFNVGRSNSSQPWNFNGDTTRVDAFGLKLAIRLQCADGTDVQRGEDYGTFLEDRSVTFQKYLGEVSSTFASTATQYAPYRIVEPGTASNFGANGANAAYYNAYIDQVWAANGIDENIVPKPTPFLRFADGSRPDLIAAVERHVAEKPGTFKADGTLVNPSFWSTEPQSAFYPAEPSNQYARFWHTHGIAGLAYGFSYDDVGSHSSDVGCNNPQHLIVAIGW